MSDPEGVALDVPDQVLSRVFSFLTDPVTLLDVLPLVCKTWRRVARLPASWAGARFQLHPRYVESSLSKVPPCTLNANRDTLR